MYPGKDLRPLSRTNHHALSMKAGQKRTRIMTAEKYHMQIN